MYTYRRQGHARWRLCRWCHTRRRSHPFSIVVWAWRMLCVWDDTKKDQSMHKRKAPDQISKAGHEQPDSLVVGDVCTIPGGPALPCCLFLNSHAHLSPLSRLSSTPCEPVGLILTWRRRRTFSLVGRWRHFTTSTTIILPKPRRSGSEILRRQVVPAACFLPSAAALRRAAGFFAGLGCVAWRLELWAFSTSSYLI